MFKQKGLQIIIECNLKVVNYLDVTFNLNDGSYQPYRKPNDETHYIHIQSAHPPSITKQLPRSIEKRLSSSNIENIKNIRKNRKRNIVWFNPPYSKSLKTNIGKYFFRLLNKHFPPSHKLYKIFNKNTLKLSYSCMPNLKAKID